jgi:hypothetical protein
MPPSTSPVNRRRNIPQANVMNHDTNNNQTEQQHNEPTDYVPHPPTTRVLDKRVCAFHVGSVALLVSLFVMSAIDGHWEGIMYAAIGVPIFIATDIQTRKSRSPLADEGSRRSGYGSQEFSSSASQTEPLIAPARTITGVLRFVLKVLCWCYVGFLCFVLGVRLAERATERDWSTFPTSCINSFPNCCRVTPADNCTSGSDDSASPTLVLQTYTDPDVHAFQVLSQIRGFFGVTRDQLGWMSGTRVKSETLQTNQVGDIVGFTLHLVVLTPLCGYPDDVAVRVRRAQCVKGVQGSESDNALVVEMQSKSRLGYGDAGTNYSRIRHLQQHIDAYVMSLHKSTEGAEGEPPSTCAVV